MRKNIIDEYESFYFVGIGGVSMSALAQILSSMGKRVAGYDICDGEYVEELIKSGISVDINTYKSIASFQAVVFTDAVKLNSPQLTEAAKTNKRIIPRGELLYELSERFLRTVAISGCHGKTTCTCMLTHIFRAAGMNFCSHIGGSDKKYGNRYIGGNEYFITEACEYNRNFLYLKPYVCVILNSDADHLDCYGSVAELRRAYSEFAKSSSKVVSIYGDFPEIDGITFGFDDRADYYAKAIKGSGGKFGFVAYEYGERLGEITLNVYGKHNVLNALAAIAVARTLGINFGDISAGLSSFTGVKRRFEFIGKINGAQCIADYAHHPNEIKASIKTAKQLTSGRLFVVFQPHTYSRTKTLFKQFVRVLSQQKDLLLYKTFAAREYYDDAGSAYTLSRAIKNSRYAESERDVSYFLKNAAEGDVVLFLGAGDIYYIAKNLL